MATQILTALGAFVGAVIGALATSWATRGQTAAERVARRREEWGRRFTTALGSFTSNDPATRAAGRALLVELLNSPLATDDDRRAAEAVLDAATTQGAPNLRLLVPPGNLDDVEVVRDTGDSPRPEGSR